MTSQNPIYCQHMTSNMAGKNSLVPVRIPEDEEDVIAMVERMQENELTDHEKNLAIAQAELIGDI